MNFDVPGIRIGHWTGAGTGVTVVLAPAGCVGAGEVRGGAPATREGALLQLGSMVQQIDAVVFSGGSAFGLAACDGVMEFLAERGQGFPTPGGVVPIVAGASIYDLVEAGDERPGAREGRLAAEAAEAGGEPERGRVGAGRGATVGKWKGVDHGVAGGLGIAGYSDGDLRVAALAVVNAAGDVVGADGEVVAGSRAPDGAPPFPTPYGQAPDAVGNTTLVVVATNASLTKPECLLVSQSAHDGFARAVSPAHTRGDGDLAITLATGTLATGTLPGAGAAVDLVRLHAADVVAEAIRDAVREGAGR